MVRDAAMRILTMAACAAAAVATIAVTAAEAAASGGGKLDDIRDEVHGDSDDDDDDDDDDNDDGGYGDSDAFNDDDDEWGGSTAVSGASPAAQAWLRMIAWPWLLPSTLIEGTGKSRGYLIGPPYAGGSPGHMTIVHVDDPEWDMEQVLPVPGSKPGDHVSVGLTLMYGYDVGGVHEPSVEARLDTSLRIGIETAWTMLLEPLDGGNVDRLTIGTIDLAIRHVQHEHVEMHTGLGWRVMIDKDHLDHGFDFFYSVDVFPVRPLVISARVELGNLGEAFLVHGRAHVGVTVRGFEFFAGYEVWRIGSVVGHGPLAGIRFWK